MKQPCVLIIDQGNTTAKVKIFSGDALVYSDVMGVLDIERLAAAIERYRPVAGIYSSVSHLDVRFTESLRPLLGDALLVVTHDTPLPLKINYATPQTLGTDRIAAACGAALLAPGRSALVVDAGTCITLDLLDAARGFIGGDIAPGVEMRLRAMHSMTGALPLVTAKGELPEFGNDTATAIRCGAIRGAVAQIADSFLRAKNLLACDTSDAPALFLTGGDAPMLAPLLELPELTVNPHLNAIGLISILKHNEYI